MHKTAIIGAGMIGAATAKLFGEAGHEVAVTRVDMEFGKC